jgi:hypothetical protein
MCINVCERQSSVDPDAECDQHLQYYFGHRNRFVLPFSLQWMQKHSMRHLLGEYLGINAQTHTVEKCLQMYSLAINTATMQHGRELLRKYHDA